jgi:hypothetical protein
VRETIPDIPVTVIVLLATGVVAFVVIVNVEFLEVASVIFTGVGLKFAAAPEGKPLAERLTIPVNPARGVTVIKYSALPPGTTDRDRGVAFTAKSGVVAAGAEATNVKYTLSPEVFPSLFA